MKNCLALSIEIFNAKIFAPSEIELIYIFLGITATGAAVDAGAPNVGLTCTITGPTDEAPHAQWKLGGTVLGGTEW